VSGVGDGTTVAVLVGRGVEVGSGVEDGLSVSTCAALSISLFLPRIEVPHPDKIKMTIRQ
jgi:hypothetical protein